MFIAYSESGVNTFARDVYVVIATKCERIKIMSNRIKEFRKKKGLSQEQLAEMLDTSSGQISSLETGKRRLNYTWMQRIAEALDCEVHELVIDSTDKDKQLEVLIRTVRQDFASDEFIEPLLIALEAAIKRKTEAS